MKTPTILRLLMICSLSFTRLCGVNAATFNIPNGDVSALKKAIRTANTNAEPDTINLAAGGTYTLTGIDNSVRGPNGLPLIKNDAVGLDLTINGNGATIERSDAAVTAEFRILQITPGAELTCRRLTIKRGKNSGGFPTGAGPGILVFQGRLN